MFLYFNLCLSVMLDSLLCSFTSISFYTNWNTSNKFYVQTCTGTQKYLHSISIIDWEKYYQLLYVSSVGSLLSTTCTCITFLMGYIELFVNKPNLTMFLLYKYTHYVYLIELVLYKQNNWYRHLIHV
jgi:hypothetical protein